MPVEVNGAALRRAREDKLLTSVEAAELSGISRATISKLENGHHPGQIATLRTLARLYGTDPHLFIDTSEAKASETGAEATMT
jgi:transcriptional regulator with XRE-family HTH domain